MGKCSKKHKKKRGRMPPLSFFDKAIYWSGLVLLFCMGLGSAFLIEFTTDAIAFRDATVIAYNNDLSIYLVLPAVLYGFISAMIYLLCALDNKQPLFGNRGVRYGQDPWDKECFPLFDPRRKMVPVKESEQAFRRKYRRLWAVGMILCLMLVPLGLFGRDCLTENHSIVSYNGLNVKASETYTEDDFSELTIRAEHVSQRYGSGYWKYEIKIEMIDGTSFRFSNRDFDVNLPDAKERILKKMLEIKALFPAESVKIVGADKLEKVVDYLNLNEEQVEMLRELFQ
jgi:hypothetical protein